MIAYRLIRNGPYLSHTYLVQAGILTLSSDPAHGMFAKLSDKSWACAMIRCGLIQVLKKGDRAIRAIVCSFLTPSWVCILSLSESIPLDRLESKKAVGGRGSYCTRTNHRNNQRPGHNQLTPLEKICSRINHHLRSQSHHERVTGTEESRDASYAKRREKINTLVLGMNSVRNSANNVIRIGLNATV